jgi:hypothetical protein
VTVGLGVDNANNILNAYRNVSHGVAAVYVMLHTGDPGVDGEDDISEGDPSLKLINFAAPTIGALEASSTPIWTNVDTTETLTHASAWDGADGPGTDTLLWTVELTDPQSWIDEDTYTLDEFGLVLTPIAAD